MTTNAIRTEPRSRCYLCGTEGDVLFEELTDRLYGVQGKWSQRRCKDPDCGLVWLDPVPEESDIGKLYERYFTHGSGNDTCKTSSLPDLASAWKKSALGLCYGYPEHLAKSWPRRLAQLACLSPWRRERIGRRILWARGEWRGRVLDVGCGSGTLLGRLGELGWEGVGYELDPQGAATARQRGLTIYEGAPRELIEKERSFDLVTMSHVIEHLLDPVEELAQWGEALRSGGRMIIVTPNFDSLGRRYFSSSWLGLDPPRHIHLFTTRTLRECAQRAGFTVDSIRTSAASAKSIWRSSSLIRWEKKVEEQRRSRPPAYAKFGGRFLSGVEQLLQPAALGEELVALLVKR